MAGADKSQENDTKAAKSSNRSVAGQPRSSAKKTTATHGPGKRAGGPAKSTTISAAEVFSAVPTQSGTKDHKSRSAAATSVLRVGTALGVAESMGVDRTGVTSRATTAAGQGTATAGRRGTATAGGQSSAAGEQAKVDSSRSRGSADSDGSSRVRRRTRHRSNNTQSKSQRNPDGEQQAEQKQQTSAEAAPKSSGRKTPTRPDSAAEGEVNKHEANDSSTSSPKKKPGAQRRTASGAKPPRPKSAAEKKLRIPKPGPRPQRPKSAPAGGPKPQRPGPSKPARSSDTATSSQVSEKPTGKNQDTSTSQGRDLEAAGQGPAKSVDAGQTRKTPRSADRTGKATEVTLDRPQGESPAERTQKHDRQTADETAKSTSPKSAEPKTTEPGPGTKSRTTEQPVAKQSSADGSGQQPQKTEQNLETVQDESLVSDTAVLPSAGSSDTLGSPSKEHPPTADRLETEAPSNNNADDAGSTKTAPEKDISPKQGVPSVSTTSAETDDDLEVAQQRDLPRDPSPADAPDVADQSSGISPVSGSPAGSRNTTSEDPAAPRDTQSPDEAAQQGRVDRVSPPVEPTASLAAVTETDENPASSAEASTPSVPAHVVADSPKKLPEISPEVNATETIARLQQRHSRAADRECDKAGSANHHASPGQPEAPEKSTATIPGQRTSQGFPHQTLPGSTPNETERATKLSHEAPVVGSVLSGLAAIPCPRSEQDSSTQHAPGVNTPMPKDGFDLPGSVLAGAMAEPSHSTLQASQVRQASQASNAVAPGMMSSDQDEQSDAADQKPSGASHGETNRSETTTPSAQVVSASSTGDQSGSHSGGSGSGGSDLPPTGGSGDSSDNSEDDETDDNRAASDDGITGNEAPKDNASADDAPGDDASGVDSEVTKKIPAAFESLQADQSDSARDAAETESTAENKNPDTDGPEESDETETAVASDKKSTSPARSLGAVISPSAQDGEDGAKVMVSDAEYARQKRIAAAKEAEKTRLARLRASRREAKPVPGAYTSKPVGHTTNRSLGSFSAGPQAIPTTQEIAAARKTEVGSATESGSPAPDALPEKSEESTSNHGSQSDKTNSQDVASDVPVDAASEETEKLTDDTEKLPQEPPHAGDEQPPVGVASDDSQEVDESDDLSQGSSSGDDYTESPGPDSSSADQAEGRVDEPNEADSDVGDADDTTSLDTTEAPEEPAAQPSTLIAVSDPEDEPTQLNATSTNDEGSSESSDTDAVHTTDESTDITATADDNDSPDDTEPAEQDDPSGPHRSDENDSPDEPGDPALHSTPELHSDSEAPNIAESGDEADGLEDLPDDFEEEVTATVEPTFEEVRAARVARAMARYGDQHIAYTFTKGGNPVPVKSDAWRHESAECYRHYVSHPVSLPVPRRSRFRLGNSPSRLDRAYAGLPTDPINQPSRRTSGALSGRQPWTWRERLVSGTSDTPPKVRKRSRRRHGIVITLLAMLCIGTTGAAAATLTGMWSPKFLDRSANINTACEIKEPVKPAEKVTVVVLNASRKAGLAGSVAAELKARDFNVRSVGDDRKFEPDVPVTIRFGSKGDAQARTVAAHFPGAKKIRDDRPSTEVTVSLQNAFESIASEDEAAERIKRIVTAHKIAQESCANGDES